MSGLAVSRVHGLGTRLPRLDVQAPESTASIFVALRRLESPGLHGGDRGARFDDLPRDEPAQASSFDQQLAVLVGELGAFARAADLLSLREPRGDLGSVRGRPDEDDLGASFGQDLPQRLHLDLAATGFFIRLDDERAARPTRDLLSGGGFAIWPHGDRNQNVIPRERPPDRQQLERDVSPLGEDADSARSTHSTFTRPCSNSVLASSAAISSTLSPGSETRRRSSRGA